MVRITDTASGRRHARHSSITTRAPTSSTCAVRELALVDACKGRRSLPAGSLVQIDWRSLHRAALGRHTAQTPQRAAAPAAAPESMGTCTPPRRGPAAPACLAAPARLYQLPHPALSHLLRLMSSLYLACLCHRHAARLAQRRAGPARAALLSACLRTAAPAGRDVTSAIAAQHSQPQHTSQHVRLLVHRGPSQTHRRNLMMTRPEDDAHHAEVLEPEGGGVGAIAEATLHHGPSRRRVAVGLKLPAL
jgi:hypothetical protein